MNASKYVENKKFKSWHKVLRKSITVVCIQSRQFQLVNSVDVVTVLSIFRLQLH